MHIQRRHQLASRFIVEKALALLDLVCLIQRVWRMRMLLISENVKKFAICPLEQLLDI
jgi:hypothetical protein